MFENYWGNTESEIFGYLSQKRKNDLIAQLRKSYKLYQKSPRKPKKTQFHRGYRDHGSLGGDKEFLKARKFDKDQKLQLLREERIKYQLTFKELEYLIEGRGD